MHMDYVYPAHSPYAYECTYPHLQRVGTQMRKRKIMVISSLQNLLLPLPTPRGASFPPAEGGPQWENENPINYMAHMSENTIESQIT